MDRLAGSYRQREQPHFNVPAGFSEVRVVLTWADPVAGANNDTVVNDLDLRVYDANNTLRGSSITIDDTVEYVKITTGARAPGASMCAPSPPRRRSPTAWLPWW